MGKFNTTARQAVVDRAIRQGFAVQLKANGQDQYDKNLKLQGQRLQYPVYVSKMTANDAGIPRYYKVALHPDEFNPSLIAPAIGIHEDINKRWNANRHSSSNYREYPCLPGNHEPIGKCYRVGSLQALERLLVGLKGQTATVSAPSTAATKPTATIADQQSSDADRCVSPQPITVQPDLVQISPRTPPSILKGLVIREPDITAILDGRKTWEMRSSTTQTRGLIALIAKGSGRVMGIAELVDVLPDLSEADMLDHQELHRIPVARLQSGETAKWRTAWVLHGAQRLPRPVPYSHPSGAVIWVNLDPATAQAILKQLPLTATNR